jgi:hypothetical protein
VSLTASLLAVGALPLAADELAEADPRPERILFIGNSHTERHGGMDWLVGTIARASEPDAAYQADARTAKGVTLEHHVRNGAPEAIRSRDYDTVVLQGYIPGSPTRTTAEFVEYAGRLGEEVQRAGARPVLYMTWPQVRRGWADLDDIVSAHREVAATLDADVAPVAIAFDLAMQERPELVLIGDDGIHATWEGAYLAAVTLYATIFGRDPVGLEYSFGVGADDAAFLQEMAARAIEAWEADATA